MVFESLVADLLNRYIGEYVQNLDKNQLKIGIWGGDVVLKNLILKQSALDELNLPIRTVYGRLGQLTLKIPWKNLYSSPVEASVDTLYLLAVPNQEIKYDATKEDQWKQDAKQKEISKVELAKQQEKEKEEGKEKAQDSFVEKLATQIIRNVQIFIKKIHIRYEDRVTNPGRPFAAGITLHNLTVHSTDENWLHYISSGQETTALFYKMLNLEAASIYWNCDTKLFSEHDPSDIEDLFLQGIADKNNLSPNYSYLLGPINAVSRLRINNKPETDLKLPKITLELDLERLQLRLSKDQYKDLIRLVDSLNHMSKATLYRKYRPQLENYIGFSKEWWHFAYKCILEEHVKRRRQNWQWSHMKQHRDQVHRYERVWRTKLTTTKLSPDVTEDIRQCENYLDAMNVILIRQKVENAVARENLLKKELTANQSGGWFSSWWGGGATEAKENKKNELMAQFEEAMTNTEKEKLYKAIGYTENSLPAEFPESFVELKCSFTLHCLEIEVRDEELESPRVLSIMLKQMKANLEKRPVLQGLKVATSVEVLSVFGLSQGGKTPQLVTSKRSKESDGALLEVLFEVNPECKTCDQRIHVNSKPLQVVYDAQTLINVSSIFTPDQSEADVMYQLQEAAATKMIEFKEMSALGLQNAITKRTVLDLNVRLSGSYLLVPQSGHYTGVESLLVVNLGSILVASKEKGKEEVNVAKMHKAGTSESEILRELIAKSYDQFVIQLNDLQVMVIYPGEKWLEPVESEIYILRPTSVSVNFDKCLIMDDPRLPKLKVLGELPKINIKMAETRLLRAFEILLSIPQKEIEAPPMDPIQELMYSSTVSLKKVEMRRRRNIAKKEQKKVENEIMQFTEMELKFILKEFNISLEAQRGKDKFLEPLVDFAMLNFELQMTQKTFDMFASVKLGGLDLVQHYKNEKINVIQSPHEQEALFSVEYNQINRKSPEFRTKYESCLQLLNVEFTKMNGIVHQEALLYIWKWVTDITIVINKLNEKKQQSQSTKLAIPKSTEKRFSTDILKKNSVIQALTSRPSTITEEETTDGKTEGLAEKRKTFKKVATATKLLNAVKADANHTKGELEEKKKQDAAKEITDLKINLNMGDLNFALHSEKYPLAKFDIDGIHLNVILKKSYTKLKVTLDNLAMFSSLPDSYYSQIMSVPENLEALKADVTMYNNDDGDTEVSAHVAQLRFVFLNRFTTALLDFINQFQAGKQAIIEASQAAVASAKQNLQDMYAAASRVSLNISIDAPMLVIPCHSKCLDAILMDFGNLTVKNSFENLETKNVKGHPAVIDHCTIQLENMKMSRITYNSDLVITSEIVLIQPVNLCLLIKRNLCVTWFKSVPDLDITGQFKTISLTLSKEDYATLMQITSGNLAEGQPATTVQQSQPDLLTVSPNSATSVTSKPSSSTLKEKQVPNPPPVDEVRKSMQFTFEMESMVLGLRNLATFTLSSLRVQGDMFSNGSMDTNVVLKDCLFDDARVLKKSKKVTRYMERKKKETDMSNMIEVMVKMSDGNMNTDLRICSFDLIMNLDFIMKILDFISVPQDNKLPAVKSSANLTSTPIKPLTSSVISKSTTSVCTHLSDAAILEPVKESRMTVNITLEKPDLILVENLDNLDTNAIIMNTEMTCRVILQGKKQVIDGTIKDLQIYSCIYNPSKREETMSRILRPVTISLAGSTPEGKGLHLDVVATPFIMSVSPATIEMLNRINQTVFKTQEQEEAELEEKDLTDLWDQRQFQETDYWFLKTERAVEAYEDFGMGNRLEEICIVSMPRIIITIEAGLPMILTQLSFQGKARNWSSKLSVDSLLTLQVRYYNLSRAIWEPLIEPVEQNPRVPNSHAPWELEMTMETNDNRNCDTEEEFKTAKPGKVINISSKQNMEITITKTCLGVLTDLGQAFNDAINVNIEENNKNKNKLNKSQFVINNKLGIDIVLNLTNANLTPAQTIAEQNKIIPLDNGNQLELNLIDQSTDLLTITEEEHVEIFVRIEIPQRNTALRIPISKADTRYYPLDKFSNGWALVCDIKVENGVSVIQLKSNVTVYNQLGTDIRVYTQLNDKKPDPEHILEISVDQSASIPLPYLGSALYFSTTTSQISNREFNWRSLQNSPFIHELIKCNPTSIEDEDPIFLNIIGELQQIYFENTNKFTMVSNNFKVTIRPTVIIKNTLPLPVVLIMQGVANQTTLESGESKTLINVEPGSSSLVIRIENYLEKQWICKKSIASHYEEEFIIWKFDSYDSIEPMNLNLGMHVTTSQSTLMLDLYCPFWMINKTDLMLTYKPMDDSSQVLYHPPSYKDAILFSFKEKAFFGKKKACIKVENGEWSDKFSLDVVGNSGCIECTYRGKIYFVGVHINLTSTSLTKMVLFTPYYVIINNCPFDIEFTEVDKDHLDNTEMKPQVVKSNNCVSYWPPTQYNPKIKNERIDPEKKMILRVTEFTDHTVAFPYSVEFNDLLRLRNKHGAVNVEVHVTESSSYITFNEYKSGMAPLLIINHTDEEIDVHERYNEADREIVKPGYKMFWTWSQGEDNHSLVWNKRKVLADARRDGMGDFYLDDDLKQKCYWISFLDGIQRVLLLTVDEAVYIDVQASGNYELFDQEIVLSMHRIGVSLVNNEIGIELMYLSVTSSGIIWETQKKGKRRYKQLNIEDSNNLESAFIMYNNQLILGENANPIVKVSPDIRVNFETFEMLLPSKKKLRRVYNSGLWLQMKSSAVTNQMHLKLNRLQIDNQMQDAIYPVIMAPVPLPKTIAANHVLKPFIEVSIVQRLNIHSQVRQYKYYKVLIQEFHVKVELGLITALTALFSPKQSSALIAFQQDIKNVSTPLLDHVSLHTVQQVKNFYDILHFSPLKIHVSFTAQGSDTSALPEFLSILMQSIGVTLTDIHDVIFKLSYFERESVFLNQPMLISEATSHYTGQFLKQAYVLVLGLDVLGNPYGLVTGLAAGVEDLFYEPFQGAIQGPEEFAEGLMIGARSFIGHTVGGVAGAGSRITAAMGKGIAALTFDKEYQRKRRMMATRHNTVHEDLAQSGKGLVLGFVEGVSGVVTKPISGAKDDGVEGFVKGMGKGVIGLVTRPVAGVVDFASGSFNAVKRVADTTEEIKRNRPPRLMSSDSVTKPYCALEAEGNAILHDLEKGKYIHTDTYLYHIHIVGKDILLLTSCRLFYLKPNDLFGGVQIEWEHTWTEFSEPAKPHRDGILIKISKQKKGFSLFGNSGSDKLLLVKNENEKNIILNIIQENVQNS